LVGQKFQGSSNARTARASAQNVRRKNKRSDALHARRNISDDLSPLTSPLAEINAGKAMLGYLMTNCQPG